MDKARIFISYAREDESAVKQLYRKLSDAGFVPWMDKVDLLPGEQWRPAIEKALRKADFLIICLSNASVQKRGFVRREFRAALDLWQEKHDDDIYIIPVRLEHCDPPDDLARFQWLDLFEDSEWPKLIRALQEGLRRRGKALLVQRIIEPAPRQKALEQALPAPTANTPLVAHKFLDAPSSPANQSQLESTTALSDDPSKVVDATEAGGGQQSKESLSADAHTEQKEQIEWSITQALEEELREDEERIKLDKKRRLFELAVYIIGWSVMLAAILIIAFLRIPQIRPMIRKILMIEKTQTTPSTEATSSQRTFSFETITLGRNGSENSRKTGQANSFVVELGNGVALEIVEIPSGSFMMGSPPTEVARWSDEDPQHRVNVPSFWMGKFEVTQKQWLAVMGGNPSHFKGDELPVDSVSWNDAQEFLASLNRKLGLQSKGRQYQYRLPSEAEWEYAARAGTDTPFAFGETITPQVVNHDSNYPYASAPKGTHRQKTVEAGSLGVANAFGLFDMHGNVYEWCEDTYYHYNEYPNDRNYTGAPTDGSAWVDKSNRFADRVLRGGSWHTEGSFCRSARRDRTFHNARWDSIGFRVVVSARNS